MTKKEVELIQEMIRISIERAMAGAFSYDYQDGNRLSEIEEELTKPSIS